MANNNNPNYGYNQGGGYNQGYNQGGYNQGAYNQGAYNQGAYNQGAYNQGAYNQGPQPYQFSPEQSNAYSKPQQYDYAQPVSQENSGAAYPQAEVHIPDPNQTPAEGQPLYAAPTSGSQNPHLRRFVKKGWKDVWAGVLFLIFFIMTIVWGSVNMAHYKDMDVKIIESDFIELRGGLAVVIVVIAAAFVISLITSGIGVVLMTCFPKGIIYIANIFSILLLIAMAVLAFIYTTIFAGVILVFCALLQILWFYCARRRIPFAAATLRAATRVLSKYKAIFAFKLIMLLVLFAYMIFWTFALIRSADHAEKDEFTGFDTFVVCLFVFTFYWVMQVLPNVMLVTTSGVTATWYFVGFDNMPPNPTLKSFVRAITTSFGSICFGSLIVAVIQFLRWLAESGRRNGQASFLTCCLVCLLGCLESMVKYFNTYAYVHIAMYGYGYITAAKHTFEMMKQCLFAALFNTSLINPTLNMLTLVFSLAIGALFGVAFWSIPVGIVAFLICVVVHSLFFTAVSSAVVTIFVCFAEVPEALRATDPDLYNVFVTADQGGTNNNAQMA